MKAILPNSLSQKYLSLKLIEWPKSIRAFAWFIICIILSYFAVIWRRPDIFSAPQLWGEDGPIFVDQSFANGLSSIFTPYAGYYHTIPRLIAWFDPFIPPELIPELHLYGSVAFILLIVLYLFLVDFPVPLPIKALLGVSLVGASTNVESLLNLPNIPFYAPLAIMLVAASPQSETNWKKIFDPIWLTLVALSTPFTIVLWPIFVIRYFYYRTRASLILLILSLLSTIVQIWHAGDRINEVTPGFPDITLDYILTIINVIDNRFGYLFLGVDANVPPERTGEIIITFAVIVALYIGLAYRAWKNENFAQIVICAACPLIVVLSMYVFRHDVDAHLLHTGRHAVIPTTAFMWLVLFSAGNKRPFELILYGVMMYAFLLLTPELKGITRPNLEWDARVAECRGTFEPCPIPINPVSGTWLATIQLEEHLFSRPDISTEIDVNFGEKIDLLGFNSQRGFQTLEIELIFKKVDKVDRSYKYFVHVIEQSNTAPPVQQVDNVPGYWKYPTSDWQEGEYIVEKIDIPLADIPAGTYQVSLGWYDPNADQFPRLQISEGTEFEIQRDVVILFDNLTVR
ncbi:MAG: hypothetical protein AAGD96_30010 [Chloroflexota bacterium]